MAEPRSTPTTRMRELAERLRELRLAKGLSVDSVSQSLLVSASKISRLENAQRRASARDVRDLCLLYGVPNSERDRLMTLAAQAQETSWYQDYALDAEYQTYVGLEEAANEICHSQSLMVPGLLQTEDYARALVSATSQPVPRGDAYIESRVEVRMRRQDLLTRADAPRVRFVIDEGMLHRALGGPVVMQAQVAKILEAIELPNVSLQVVPLAVGAHPGMDGRFNVLSFTDKPIRDTVYVEGLLGELFLDKEEDVRRYLDIFEYLSAEVALGPDDSRVLLQRIHTEWSDRR